MNTYTYKHTVRRRFAACVAAAVVFPVFAACGADVEAPAQDISRQKVEKKDAVPAPKRTTGNRYDFRDEYGKGEVAARKARPAGSGTRNRMDFGDNGW